MSSSLDIPAIATQLFLNGFRFRLLRAMRKSGKIKALSIEITHRCICHCIMCNIWKIPSHTPELSIADWSNLLADDAFSDLVELDITGGEPFLVNDLPDLFRQLREHRKRHLRQLRSVAITTNGVLTEKILKSTKNILQLLEGTDIQLVLACAMDGIDDRHDVIRGLPGAFQKLQTTLQKLFKLREQNASLILGIKTTIVPSNVDQLSEIDAYARQHGLFSIISPCIITGGRFLNSQLEPELRFEQSQLDAMARFFAGNTMNWAIHNRSLDQFLKHGKSNRQCSCGFHYAFIRSSGDVLLCPLLPPAAGSLKSESFQAIWTSRQARDLRGSIGRSDVCTHCTEPGLERYALVNEGWSYLALLFKMGPRRFRQLHCQLGLQNYFTKNK